MKCPCRKKRRLLLLVNLGYHQPLSQHLFILLEQQGKRLWHIRVHMSAVPWNGLRHSALGYFASSTLEKQMIIPGVSEIYILSSPK